MTCDEWNSQFQDELKKLRPHVGDRLAHTLALTAYNDKGHPRVAAHEYHKRQQPTAAPAPAKKRAK